MQDGRDVSFTTVGTDLTGALIWPGMCLISSQSGRSLSVKSKGSDRRGLMEFKAIHLYQSSHVTRAANTPVTELYLILCDPTDCSTPGSFCPWDFPGKNTGVSYHFLLQGFFPTQGWNPYLLHWQAASLPLSHHGSPFVDNSNLLNSTLHICILIMTLHFETKFWNYHSSEL